MRNSIKLILFVFFTLIIIYGCEQKKGCTDKSALNYNVVAEDDDGSCIICKSSNAYIASTSGFLRDNNSSSPFYNQDVVSFYLHQHSTKYSDDQCGKETCWVNAEIINNTDKEITFSYFVYINNISASFESNNFVVIAPKDTLKLEDVGLSQSTNICNSIVSSNVSISTRFGNIIYN